MRQTKVKTKARLPNLFREPFRRDRDRAEGMLSVEAREPVSSSTSTPATCDLLWRFGRIRPSPRTRRAAALRGPVPYQGRPKTPLTDRTPLQLVLSLPQVTAFELFLFKHSAGKQGRFKSPVTGFEAASSPPPVAPAEPAYVSGAHAGDVRLSGSMTLSRPAPGVRFSAVAITAAGSLSWKGEVSCWHRERRQKEGNFR